MKQFCSSSISRTKTVAAASTIALVVFAGIVYAQVSIPGSCTTPGSCDALTPKMLSIDITGTASGSHVHAESILTSSGTIYVGGNAYFDERVGIGTRSLYDESALEVADSDDSGSGSVVVLKSMKATLEQNDVIAEIDFSTLDEGTESSPYKAAYVQVAADENWDSSNRGTTFNIITTLNGQSSPGTRIKVEGNGFVGINNGNAQEQLDVTGQIESTFDTDNDTTVGVCKNQTDGQGLNVEFRECNGTPSDIAELFETQKGVEAGDIVYATDDTFMYIEDLMDPLTGMPLVLDENGDLVMMEDEDSREQARKVSTISVLAKLSATEAQKPVGVISTNPYQVYGRGVAASAKNPQPLALTGRVPVKVSSINGSIAPGDLIAVSSLSGIGQKAVESGWTVGTALEHFSCDSGTECIGTVMTMVDVSWYDALSQENLLQMIQELQGRVEDLESQIE